MGITGYPRRLSAPPTTGIRSPPPRRRAPGSRALAPAGPRHAGSSYSCRGSAGHRRRGVVVTSANLRPGGRRPGLRPALVTRAGVAAEHERDGRSDAPGRRGVRRRHTPRTRRRHCPQWCELSGRATRQCRRSGPARRADRAGPGPPGEPCRPAPARQRDRRHDHRGDRRTGARRHRPGRPDHRRHCCWPWRRPRPVRPSSPAGRVSPS